MFPDQRPSRVVIDRVLPQVDGGRYPIKRVIGDEVEVEAHVYTDGHDMLSVTLLDAHGSDQPLTATSMKLRWNDEWTGSFSVRQLGRHRYTVQAQIDRFGTWRRDTLAKVRAGIDVSAELQAGARLIEEAASRTRADGAAELMQATSALPAANTRHEMVALIEDSRLRELMDGLTDDASLVRYERELEVTVDLPRARTSAWYELFPRSAADRAGRHGTFKDVVKRLDRIERMGFDVLYLPPIHPIGRQFRKGPNNSLESGPGDPGSPWAIGGSEGGHKAVHPALGTLEDFTELVDAARERGIEVALDIAFQCSPDHPYVIEHPEWFRHRPDGTIQYAENPPKKYQDIYPFDFECEHWADLWGELKSVFDFWIEQGVRTFRVDNPHTKALAFWEWAIGAIKEEHPDVVFLSEAFTRPKVMYRLAKLGFTQSYTYFAWRNAKKELTDYLTELTQSDVVEFFGPNLWPNTPDILTEYLQTGGRPAFVARLVLAATLGASYGIYGPAFELCEHRPKEPGSEEYLDSEKYQLRHWELDREQDNLTDLVTRVNRIRREHHALHRNDTLRFHEVDNPDLICYSKRSTDGEDVVLTVVNLDPHHRQWGWTALDLEALGVHADAPFQVRDLLTDHAYAWNGPHNYVELDPQAIPAHVFHVRGRGRSEQDFDYFA